MSHRSSRRDTLRLTGLALTGTLAGCGTLGGSETPEAFTVAHLSLFNEDSRPHTIHLRIEADGDTIKRGSYDLPSASGNVVGDKELDPKEFFDGTTHRLTLRGHVDDRTPVTPGELTTGEFNGDCTEITYHVQEDGSLHIEYLAAGESDSCETTSQDRRTED